ncbi:MAG: hypothetical protein WDO12_11815 [Pseudomonadota bacterium]
MDLTQGLRHPPQRPGEYGLTSAPAVWHDLVIVGSSIADNGRAQMPSGEVRAFDTTTGALRWTFHPLPEDSPAGAANTWSRITVDEPNGLVFLPTGSASPDYYGGLRPGNNGYANSIVALKAATGEVVWHFQTVHHDLWDYDVASPPLLWTSRKGPAVAVGFEDGPPVPVQTASRARRCFPSKSVPYLRATYRANRLHPRNPFPRSPRALSHRRPARAT